MFRKLRNASADPARYVHKALFLLNGRRRLPFWLRELAGRVVPSPGGHSRFRSLYVVTYGRSGSTLTTSYLSHLPGIDLKGENFMFPMPAFDAEQRLTRARRKPYGHRDQKTSPWYGAHKFDANVWRRDIAVAMLNQLYPYQLIPKTVGFKEIRWERGADFNNFEARLEWLLSLRTPGAVVFISRSLDKVMASAWWAEQSEEKRAETRARLAELDTKMAAYAAAHPDHALHITYEAFTAGPSEAERICKFLQVQFDEQVWQGTLSKKHSYQPTDRAEAAARKAAADADAEAFGD